MANSPENLAQNQRGDARFEHDGEERSNIATITPEKHGLDVFDSMLSLCTAKTRGEIRDLYAIEPVDMSAEISIVAHSVGQGFGNRPGMIVHELEVASIDGPDTKWIFNGITGEIISIEYTEENYIGEEDKSRIMALSRDVQRIADRYVTSEMDLNNSFGTSEFDQHDTNQINRRWIGNRGQYNRLNSNQTAGYVYSEDYDLAS